MTHHNWFYTQCCSGCLHLIVALVCSCSCLWLTCSPLAPRPQVHYLGDPGRGSVWEEAVIHCPRHIQMLAMSATVKNPDDLGGWISKVRGGVLNGILGLGRECSRAGPASAGCTPPVALLCRIGSPRLCRVPS